MNKSLKDADRILFAIFIALIATGYIHHLFPNNWYFDLLFSMAEAGFVGGVADWFAVTALLKKPLGLPIPHTELIHGHREQMIDKAAEFIQEKIFNRRTMVGILRKKEIDFIGEAIEKTGLDDAANRKDVVLFIAKKIVDTVELFDVQEPAEKISNEFCKKMDDLKVAPMLAKIAKYGWTHGIVSDLINQVVAKLILIPHETYQVNYYDLLNEHGNMMIRATVDYQAASNSLATETVKIISDLQNPGTELRKTLDQRIVDLIDNLDKNEKYTETIERWKEDVLNKQDFSGFFRECLISGKVEFISRMRYIEDGSTQESNWVVERVGEWVAYLKNNNEQKAFYNKMIRKALISFVLLEKEFIGKVVRTALLKKDKAGINALLIDVVGDDLAWIRKNGSLMGAALGAIAFLLGNFVIDPIVGESIRSWTGLK